MTKIDPRTGLASLPDTYFWRVTEGTYGVDPIFYLHIVHRKEEVVKWLSWFSKEKTKTTVSEEVIYEGYVWNRDVKYGSEFAKYVTPKWLQDSSVYEYENYLEECEKSRDAQQYREGSKKYVGDYPPKSINRKETP